MPPPPAYSRGICAGLVAAVPVIAGDPVPVIAEVPFAATVIKEGGRYLIQVPARPGQIYCLEVPDGSGGMTFAGVPGTAVYAQSDTVRWPLELAGTVVGAEEEGNPAGVAAGASPPAAGGTVLLPLTIEVSESPGTHVRLLVGGANPWVAVAAAAFPRVTFEGFADLPMATGVRCTALSTRVVTAPIGASEPGKAALTLEQQQEFDAILAGLPQLIAAATLPPGAAPALGTGGTSPLAAARYFRVAMYVVDSNGNGFADADELAGGMNPFARPGETGYVNASGAGVNGVGGMSPIWDRDEDFSPDFEEIAAGTSMFEKRYARVVLTCQKFDRYAEFDSAGSWREFGEGRIVGWERAWDGFNEEMLSWSPPSLLVRTTPRTLAGFMSDFESGWENPNPKSGKGLPPQSLFEEYFMLPALIARRVKPVAGNPSVTSGYIRAIGDRYRLRGPLSSEDQHRQFLKVTWTQTTGFDENQSVEYAAWSLMGQPLLEQEPTSVEVVTLTIPRGSLYSDPPHDVVPQYSVPNGPANPEMLHSQVGEYLKVVRLLPIEVVELSPKTKDEAGNEIAGSEKPSTGRPLTPFVEVDPNTSHIAHRELKVMIGSALKDKKVTWSLEPLPGATSATIRGQWEDSPSHGDRFETSTAYGANGFRRVSQQSGETTVGADGHTAIRVNVPPIGFNQVRIKVQIEGSTTPINLIDMEVPAIVVIDPGHGGTGGRNGGSDPDHAECPKPPEGSGLTEKGMTLDYGTLLRTRLQKLRTDQHLNLKIYMTREGDTNPSLADRANQARDTGADVLISLHFNGYDKKVRGTETYYRSTGNVNTTEDSALADRVNASVFGSISSFDTGAKNRGVKSDGLGVLSDGSLGNTADFHPVRAVLLETEFIDVLEVDKTLNTNANAATVKQDIIDDLGDALLDDLRNNPAQ